MSQDLAGAGASAPTATTADQTRQPPKKKQKVKHKTQGRSALDVVGGAVLEEVDPPRLVVDLPDPGHVTPGTSPLASSSPDIPPGSTPGTGSDHDPNEPLYCICNQVSYGDMVGCDNKDCPYEWFHYPCVGITAAPKGKWYCQPCLGKKGRGGRK